MLGISCVRLISRKRTRQSYEFKKYRDGKDSALSGRSRTGTLAVSFHNRATVFQASCKAIQQLEDECRQVYLRSSCSFIGLAKISARHIHRELSITRKMHQHSETAIPDLAVQKMLYK